MKKLMLFTFLIPVLCLAQSPVDGFIKKKGNGSATVTNSFESYSDVFLVPQKVNEVPIFNKVNVRAISLYIDYAITDDLMVIANLPYIQTEGFASAATLENNGFENQREGLQDLAIYTKYKVFSKEIGSGQLNLIGSAGVELPVGNYDVDEGLQSILAIGNRSTDITGIGIASYQHNSGFFATGQLGYSFRSNQVPNAFINELKLGYAAHGFYVDGFIANQISQGGVDILGPGFTGFFPATQLNFTRIGLNGYVPLSSYVGIVSGINTFISGRNLGDSTGVYAGLSFSF